MAGISFGISQFFMFGLYAVTFYVGAVLVRYDDLNPKDMYIAIFAIMFCSMGAGSNS